MQLTLDSHGHGRTVIVLLVDGGEQDEGGMARQNDHRVK